MVDLSINREEVSKKIIYFLKSEFSKRNKKVAVLGFSGGIDSALCAYLCQKAELDLYAVVLPCNDKSKDGIVLVEEMGLKKDHIFVVDIFSATEEIVKGLEEVITMGDMDRGNIMARQRMIVQYAIARRLNGLVVGTENLSEYYLGYFTLFGDQACDISPIAGLWKTQVRELAEYLKVPKWVLDSPPTAGLWDGQTDEKELGFSYEDADKIMYLYLIKKFSKEKIADNLFNIELVNKILERVKNTEYKRSNLPKFLF